MQTIGKDIDNLLYFEGIRHEIFIFACKFLITNYQTLKQCESTALSILQAAL